ncbi:MAG: A/G-specific adenine glycosylase [Bacteroidia bacterium]|nr:A/G-specific adenine glycosylase [Bacteroidia bacterium]
MSFSQKILNWYDRNKRHLPWRNTKDPYPVWLSEIIMQQTRIAQGLPYFSAFISKYPSIFSLSEASESEILKDWQGLGYYSRARNMHETAKFIVGELQGEFPDNYEELLKLKGVGDYTASAIASICFNEKKAVLDGNVYRVLSRYFDINNSIDSSQGTKYFKTLANEIIDKDRPGDYNQGIMEVGAIICKPSSPLCESCPISDGCLALARNTITMRPVKKSKKPVRKRYFNYLLILDRSANTRMIRRGPMDIWQHLFEFPLLETNGPINSTDIRTASKGILGLKNYQITGQLYPKDKVHKLSHQHLYTRFWIVKTPELVQDGTPWEEVEQLPVPVLIQEAISAFKNSYF